MNSKYESIERIRRSHRSAKPNPAENPAWANCHHDCGVLLKELERLQETERKALEFLYAFNSGGPNQEFKTWARQLYRELYNSSGGAIPEMAEPSVRHSTSYHRPVMVHCPQCSRDHPECAKPQGERCFYD